MVKWATSRNDQRMSHSPEFLIAPEPGSARKHAEIFYSLRSGGQILVACSCPLTASHKFRGSKPTENAQTSQKEPSAAQRDKPQRLLPD